MSTEDQARQQATQQRLHTDHLQETAHERAEEMLETVNPAEQSLNCQVRDQATQQRLHADHLQDTMHERAATHPEQ